MDFPMFDFLEGVSPWWWVATGLLLGATEMATMSFFLIWWGLAALIMGALLALFPSMPGEVQIMAFAALAVGLTFLGRSMVRNFGDGEPETTLNSRSANMIGRSAKVIRFDHGDGVVEIGGEQWKARADATALGLTPGAMVRVVGADGMTLTVETPLAAG
ncbi:NfeD family protein [Halovulum sp. GXIMD14793]